MTGSALTGKPSQKSAWPRRGGRGPPRGGICTAHSRVGRDNRCEQLEKWFALPADAAAQLGGLALILALLEVALEGGEEHDDQREEHDQAERGEGDHLVVGLAEESLAV